MADPESPIPTPTSPLRIPQIKKGWPKILIISLVTIASLGVLIGVFFVGQQFSKKENCPTSNCNTPMTTSQKNTLTFVGKSLKLSFEYPADWGEAKEEVTLIGDAQNYHGHNYRLSFTQNPYLTIVGASKDSSSPGVGGACPIRVFFKGTAETGMLSCNQCDPENEGCGGCQATNIGGQSAVSFLYKPTTHCANLGFQKIIYLKTPYNSGDHDFPGLVFTLNITSSVNSQLADLGYRSGSGCSDDGPEQEQQRKYLGDNFDSLCKEQESSLLSSKPDDYLSRTQLNQLMDMLKTISFTN